MNRIYNWDVENRELPRAEFVAALISAGRQARLETLRAGVPVFYWDSNLNLDIMEQSDGRRFEIRFIPGGTRETNYEIVGELGRGLHVR
jgi:hypothetical protein